MDLFFKTSKSIGLTSTAPRLGVMKPTEGVTAEIVVQHVRALIDQAVSFDQLFFQQSCREKQETQHSKRHPSEDYMSSNTGNTSSNSTQRVSSNNANPMSNFTSEPRPRGSLTQAERDHRARQNLFFRCGQPGHRASHCSGGKYFQPRSNVNLTSNTNSRPESSLSTFESNQVPSHERSATVLS
jgi:hypothetical protein